MAKIVTSLFGMLELLPYQAQTPFAENLEFLTDLFQSQNGTEQRLALRSIARQKFKVSIPLGLDKIPGAFNSQYNAIRKQWALPIWSDVQYVGTVAAGAMSIECDTTIHDLRANSLAFLYSATGWQVIEISTITATQINLTSAASAINQAYIMPLRLAHIVGNIETSTTGYGTVSTINFQIDDTLALVPAAPAQYLGNDIYFEPTLLGSGDVTRNFTQRQDVIDYDLGLISYRAPWLNTEYQTAYFKLCQTPQEAFDFRSFLYRRQGKFRAFWSPTFDVNMRVKQTGQVLNVLTVAIDNYNDYSPRDNIAINTTDGEWHTFAIVASADQGNGTNEVQINSNLNYDASQISNVCYLGLNRLDTDTIDISWNGNGEAESTFNIMEISP